MSIIVSFIDDTGKLSTVSVWVENARNARQAETMAADSIRAEGYVVCRARAA